MFDSILTFDEGSLSFKSSLICVLVALVLGMLICGAYILLMKKRGCSEHFALTMILLPAVVAVVILMVGSNVARAFSLAGIFTLIRFRSVPGDAKDIMFVFLGATIGLSCGMGYLTFAAIFAVILCIALVLFGKIFAGAFRDKNKTLRIVIPEDMSYQGLFDDLFAKYANEAELERVKTTNLGTLFELQYKLRLKEDCNEKELIDEIRCRNGNLNVALYLAEHKGQQL